MKRLLELKQKREAQIKKLRALVAAAETGKRSLTEEEQGDFEAIESEIDSLDKEIAREERLLNLETSIRGGAGQSQDPGAQQQEDKPQYRSVFFKALRGQSLTSEELAVMQEHRALSAKTGEDGGYIVPEDITTEINTFKKTVDSLEQYVTVEPVSTNKGARTLEKRADSTPFAPLSEYGDPNAMQKMNSPKFDRLPYNIEDYAGFLPVPNTLLDDSDQSLAAYLKRWIGKKSVATRNFLILQKLETLTKVNFVDYKGIKKALNVTLDPLHARSATIFTNQDGFNYLDQLEDGNKRPLLQPDPTNATRKTLFGKPVVVLSNRTMATEDDKAPFIVGDLKEAVVLWDRQQMSLDMTKEGGQAWRTNTTEFRAIEREDVTLWDDEAVVYGQIDITPVA